MALLDWIAKPNELATEVDEPIYIEFTAIEELLFYHPTPPSNGVCKLKLALNDAGTHVVVEELSGNWNPKWLKILDGLEFSEVVVRGVTMLEDNNRQPVKFGVSEWQVVNWRIVETQNGAGQKIFQELLSWENAKGDKSFSSYAWLPYKPST